MLANGFKLEYSATSGGTFTKLAGLKEIPEMGADPEKVENTTLDDKLKHYEQGIGDPGDMVYKFKYDNTSATSSYRVLRKLADAGSTVYFKETAPDGTVTAFSGTISVKRSGGGSNAVIEFDLSIALASDLEITDPTASA